MSKYIVSNPDTMMWEVRENNRTIASSEDKRSVEIYLEYLNKRDGKSSPKLP